MLQEATKAYERAIKRNPRDASCLSALGYLYGTIGENLEIAKVLCRESTEIDPDNGLYRFRLGRLYQEGRDYEMAVEQFKIAQEAGEDCSEIIEELEGLVQEQDA
jgi:tetratricopeptide (TPR) repeat protein